MMWLGNVHYFNIWEAKTFYLPFIYMLCVCVCAYVYTDVYIANAWVKHTILNAT